VREAVMTLWERLFSRKPRQRIRICVECGMPIAEHKPWCSIWRTLEERKVRGDGSFPSEGMKLPSP
jgi:hypothetical protein